jgi:hypothetical protein
MIHKLNKMNQADNTTMWVISNNQLDNHIGLASCCLNNLFFIWMLVVTQKSGTTYRMLSYDRSQFACVSNIFPLYGKKIGLFPMENIENAIE